MNDPGQEKWIRLVFRPLPHAAPAAVRLRMLLKTALRRFGFRLEEIEWLPPPGRDPESESGETRP